jgi:hypothetical protein
MSSYEMKTYLHKKFLAVKQLKSKNNLKMGKCPLTDE